MWVLTFIISPYTHKLKFKVPPATSAIITNGEAKVENYFNAYYMGV